MADSDLLSQFRSQRFDVLVIGGGIYGSWTAAYCARGGLKTAIIEMNDWGGGTSSASSKLLHGGLRYLERYEFGMVRKSLLERQELFQRMPHHVRPLTFLLPIYNHSRFWRWQLKAGLWLYDLLAGRNQPVGRHKSLSASSVLQAERCLSEDNLISGFSYGDCGTDDGRMVLEVIDSAVAAGAKAQAGIRAESLIRDRGRITGVVLSDVDSGERCEVQCDLVVNASGPWVFGQKDSDTAWPQSNSSYRSETLRCRSEEMPARSDEVALSDPEQQLPRLRRTKGVHLVMPGGVTHHAVLLTSRTDGRVFFLIPWYGRTLLGTTDTNHDSAPEDIRVTPEDVTYLLTSANEYLATPWTESDVLGAFAGLRTMLDDTGASASSVSREWLLHETEPGLLTSIGGKYTSARIDGFHAAETVFKQLKGRELCDSEQPLAWFPGEDYQRWVDQNVQRAIAAGTDEETALNGVRRFGSRFTDVISLCEHKSELAKRIVDDLPFCRAEVVHAAKNERVRSLVDILRRRIPLMILTPLAEAVVSECCQLAAGELNWDSERQSEEVSAVLEQSQAWASPHDVA